MSFGLKTAALAAAIAAGCSTPTPTPTPGPTEPAPLASNASPTPPSDAAPEATHHIGETEARAILADAFRKAGFRILYDVALAADGQAIAIDGFDPRKNVGYEYIANEELATAERFRKFAPKSVLIVGPATREDVQAAAATFVASLIASQEK